ncbi:hypothetical protein GMDG_05842 [Pseudogymnoascus destructans 20631-21]|uniref:Uncharacterized protein n=1 Tax=Pseudogymnoascus destructans (strain ATCC MYA-4855 / 20631-21) TaxID=658429 RepID=L8FPZ5_PSED2|nr:hypothetical protein GMDG_05842 [Pseudogymnoascus destructans 20631-21]
MPLEHPDIDDNDDNGDNDGDGMSHRATATNTPPQLQFQPSPPPTAPPQPKSGAAPMHMLFMDPPTASHRDENREPTAASPIAAPLTTSGFLSNPNTTVRTLFSRSTHRSYDPIDGSHRDADGFSANTSPLLTTSEGSKGYDLASFRRRLHIDTTTSPARFEIDDNDDAVTAGTALLHEPVVRRASTRAVRVRHPTPGLQTLQGAYTANVVQLERSAEKLSMTSSIGDSIRNAYEEVKKLDSRMNSLRQSSLMSLVTDIPYEGVSTSTQLTSAVEVASPTFPTRDTSSSHSTTSTSILDVNNATRSGGYSPGGAVILGVRPRADSKTSKYGTRPEPEMEGRQLSEFVSSRNNSYLSSRNVSGAPSIAEKEEEAAVRRPLAVRNLSADDIDVDEEKTDIGLNKIVPDDSQSKMEQAQELFDDFDGQHYANMAGPSAPPPPPPLATEPRPDIQKRRDSSANTLSMARPKSYADPLTGQQMVFYPAPVPSMLMLPQKLSNRPSPAKREKRRTQAFSSLPPLALQSAPWLQDVVEGQTEHPEQVPDEVLDAEYLAQHHKQKVGGRRSTQDLLHMPEHLRANEYFEQPQPNQLVEIKEQSAVATLDNILDASAYAPVSAFTDHTYAGRLGAEVYGAHDPRSTRTKSQLVVPEAPKKRVSSFFGLGLGGGDKSDRARSSTVTSMLGLDKTPSYTAVAEDAHSPCLPPSPSNGLDGDGFDGDADPSAPPFPRERDHDDAYIGAPTTLLAELQLRKQHAKTRTQHPAQLAGSRSTLLELDAVALVESKARQQKRVTLAWQDPHPEEEEGDDDVPLGVLFPGQALQQLDRAARPMGLMERRELEDNEPLSQRRERLLGKGGCSAAEDANPLPNARPVSGAFSLELLNQFGDPSSPDVAPEGEEEEETLGQRRRRLLAEREAAAASAAGARPAPKQRRSMADILSAHPAASRGEYPHLAEHLQQQQQQQQQRGAGHRQSVFAAPPVYPEMGMNYQNQVGGGMGSGMTGREMLEQMKAIRARQAQQGGQGGVDMVERWRRSVMLPGA